MARVVSFEEKAKVGGVRDFVWLGLIILVVAGALWLLFNPNFPFQPGLDLQGGLQVLLASDLPDDIEVTADEMDTARQIISQRVNALGVSEPLVQVEGERRILVELPGIDDPDEAIDLIRETALLEFIATGTQPLLQDTCVRTSLNEGQASPCEEETGPLGPPTEWETVMTGGALANADVELDGLGQPMVIFDLTDEGSDIFRNYTGSHIGEFLTIVLDKKVISSPQIQTEISDSGSITGQFTQEEARNLALQLRFGRLPVPLRVESTREVGATLGQLSIDASIQAGIIGVSVVLLFMLIYYRLPGFLADIALIIYALINFAIFKGLGVTLTLPAITGFLLSTGMAVDANILVFERMKEELRGGNDLPAAIVAGFSRAWTSIRDSNIATLVICFILWSFGRNFGASSVQGFAITLAIGVFISLFTALIVTRTFIRILMGRAAGWLENQAWLLGT